MKELIDELRNLARQDSWASEPMRNAADALESQALTIEKLEAGIPRLQEQLYSARKELAELKTQPGGVVLPERKQESPSWGYDMGGNYDEGHADGWNQALDEVARLNQPASAGDERAFFEDRFKKLDLTTYQDEEGDTLYRDDLTQGAFIGWQARAALSANHSEQVRDGWRLVPMDMTPAMYSAFCEARGVLGTTYKDGWKAALAAAPSAGSQKEKE